MPAVAASLCRGALEEHGDYRGYIKTLTATERRRYDAFAAFGKTVTFRRVPRSRKKFVPVRRLRHG
jgi:hypothetical protein